MKKILLIGKMNDTVKDVNSAISESFSVQLCGPDANSLEGMMKIYEPDLILISLIGLFDMDTSIFSLIASQHRSIPVLTIGTESEKKNFLKYYDGGQFENLIRPIGNLDVMRAIGRKLDIDVSFDDEGYDLKDKNAKKMVLIVDDNAATLRSIKAMIDHKYDVTVATSGMKAMTAIGKKRPDLILLDYEMPVCDGKQTLEMIRADEDLCDIPVIFLTGVNDREHIQAVMALHPSGYLLKPAVQERLLREIEQNVN